MTGPRNVLATLLTLIVLPAHAAGQNYSANAYLPGCEELIEEKINAEVGRCMGVVEGLAILGQVNNLWCAPNDTTTGQWVRVIVKYVHSKPERMHEDFRLLAIEALKKAWPCR